MAHVCAGRLYAITDAGWASNFAGTAPVLVVRRGRRLRGSGLVLPPDRLPTDEELCALRRVVLLSGPGLGPQD